MKNYKILGTFHVSALIDCAKCDEVAIVHTINTFIASGDPFNPIDQRSKHKLFSTNRYVNLYSIRM